MHKVRQKTYINQSTAKISPGQTAKNPEERINSPRVKNAQRQSNTKLLLLLL